MLGFDALAKLPLASLPQASSAGSQTLLPSLFTNTNTFHAPQVNLRLLPSLYTDADAYFAPKANLRLLPSLYADADTFYTPKLSLRLFPSALADSDTFYSPQVNLRLIPSIYSDGDTFYSPQVNLRVAPAMFTDADAFYAPQVNLRLYVSLFADPDTFHGTQVNQRLYPGHFEDPDGFYDFSRGSQHPGAYIRLTPKQAKALRKKQEEEHRKFIEAREADWKKSRDLDGQLEQLLFEITGGEPIADPIEIVPEPELQFTVPPRPQGPIALPGTAEYLMRPPVRASEQDDEEAVLALLAA